METTPDEKLAKEMVDAFLSARSPGGNGDRHLGAMAAALRVARAHWEQRIRDEINRNEKYATECRTSFERDRTLSRIAALEWSLAEAAPANPHSSEVTTLGA